MSWTLSQPRFRAAAGRGARAAGRLLPAGHTSLWSFPGYSRTLTAWAIAGPQAETLPCSQQLSPALLGASRVQTSALCPRLCPPSPPWFSPACARPRAWMGGAFPTPGAQAVSISGLFPLVGPVSDLPIEMGFPARREQLGGPGEPLGSDKEL